MVPAELHDLSDVQLSFMLYWKVQAENDFIDRLCSRLERILGTFWTYDDIYSKEHSEPTDKPKSLDEVRIPLAVAINPKLHDWLRKLLAPKGDVEKIAAAIEKKTGQPVTSLMDISKDEFYQVMDKMHEVAMRYDNERNERLVSGAYEKEERHARRTRVSTIDDGEKG